MGSQLTSDAPSRGHDLKPVGHHRLKTQSAAAKMTLRSGEPTEYLRAFRGRKQSVLPKCGKNRRKPGDCNGFRNMGTF